MGHFLSEHMNSQVPIKCELELRTEVNMTETFNPADEIQDWDQTT